MERQFDRAQGYARQRGLKIGIYKDLALAKMRRALAKHESIRTHDEVEEEDRVRQRMEVIREFVESKHAGAPKTGRN